MRFRRLMYKRENLLCGAACRTSVIDVAPGATLPHEWSLLKTEPYTPANQWWNQAETRRIWVSPHLVYSIATLPHRCPTGFISLVAVAGFQFPDDDDHDDRMMVITARCRCVTLNVDSSERVFLLLYRASLIVVNRHCSRSRISGCRKNCGRVNAAKFVKVVQPLQNIG